MTRRRGGPLAVAVLLTAVLLGCDGQDDPGRNDSPGPSARPSGDGSEAPATLRLADAAFEVGPAEIVMGPSTYVDSPLNAIKIKGTVRAYVGNVSTVLLEGSSVADLVPTDREVIGRGRTEADFDWCGAWLDAVERDQRDPGLLRAWYHAEADCAYRDNETHKSIAYAESRDGGLTFTKPDYPDNQVVRSPTGGAIGHHTGRGAPGVVRRGRFFYMYYRNVLPDLTTITSVARAPVSSGGVPGSWRNYTEDGWTASALEGPAAGLDIAVNATAASIHEPSGEVMLIRQYSPRGGIVLQTSTDGIHFTELPEPLAPHLHSQIRSDWSEGDDQQIIGYVSAVAADGSRRWTDEFYLFHMYVFPGDELRDGRYLVRRKVTVTEAAADQPRSTVTLTTYVHPGSGDTFDTSAPLRAPYDARGVLGYLLATPGPDRVALFECESESGGHFVGAQCGERAQQQRLVGYAFTSEQPGTVGLFRCLAEGGDQFTSTDEDCESRGRLLSDLGFVYPADD